MSVDFGSSNTTGYYSIPDSDDFTLPNGDWTWMFAGYKRSHTAGQYMVSNGAFAAASSFNMFIYSDTQGLSLKVDTLGELYNFSGTISNNTYYLFYGARRSGVLYAGAVPFGASSYTEGTGVAISAGYDSANAINIGRRQDGFADRYWHGNAGYVAFSNTRGITQAEALAIANGAPLLNTAIGASCNFILPMHTSANATITDIVGGKTATKNGSSYGTLEDELFSLYPQFPEYVSIAQAGAGTTKGVRVTLYNKSAALQANITGIHVAWFDQNVVGSLSTPVFVTSTATTNASGLLQINIDAVTALSIGQEGFIVIYKPDGVNSKLSPVFASLMQVINIA